MRIHTGERPFACPYCNFKAISSGVLCRHKQKEHPRQWEERERNAKPRVKVSRVVDYDSSLGDLSVLTPSNYHNEVKTQ